MTSPRDPSVLSQPSAYPGPRASSLAVCTTQILIGALVPPVLIGLVAARLIADGFRQAGHLGDAILQGQRLPHLQVNSED